jgi:hypothetical protein
MSLDLVIKERLESLLSELESNPNDFSVVEEKLQEVHEFIQKNHPIFSEKLGIFDDEVPEDQAVIVMLKDLPDIQKENLLMLFKVTLTCCKRAGNNVENLKLIKEKIEKFK